MPNRIQALSPAGRVLVWASLSLFVVGCAGVLDEDKERPGNAAITLVSFGSVQGEILECG